jgi:hypothetical protein
MIGSTRTQVLVVGGGGAGLSAALAAGRNGADTLLIEYQGFVGGNSTILPWLGFHARDFRQVVKGIPLELVTRMQERRAATSIVLDPVCSSAVALDGHQFKCLAMELLREAGVRLMLHTQAVDVIRRGDRVVGVVVEHKSGRQVIEADVVIDTSGDGDVAARGGVPWEKGRTGDGMVQAPTLVFRIGDVDRAGFIGELQRLGSDYRELLRDHPDAMHKLLGRLPEQEVIVLGGFAEHLERAKRDGRLDVPATRVVGVFVSPAAELIAVTTKVATFDPTDVGRLTAGYQDAFEQIPQLLRFFREYVPGFERSTLREIAPMIGVRESRRIVGDYMLTGDDVMAGRQFEDVVAMGGYHIDIHRPDGSWVDSRNVQPYDIPFRSLVGSGVENLLMAGKCVSATHEGIASTRVIPICMAEGQAVGTAAALAVAGRVGPREVPIRTLQDRLIERGAELRQGLGEPDRALMERIGSIDPGRQPSPAGV